MTESVTPSSGGPAILLALAIACIAIFGGIYRWTPTPQGFNWETLYWVPEGQDVEAYLRSDQNLLTEYAAVEGEERLIESFRAANLASFSLQTGQNIEAYRSALTRLEEDAGIVLKREGTGAYRSIGLRLWRDLAQGLQDENNEVIRSLGANLMEEVRRAGLVNAEGAWGNGSWLLVRMLFMARWSTVVQQITPADLVLHPLERRVIPAWKAEAHADMTSPDLQARLRHARDAAQLNPSYPLPLVQGILYLKYGLMDQAVPLLKQGAEGLPEGDLMKVQVKRLERLLRVADEVT